MPRKLGLQRGSVLKSPGGIVNNKMSLEIKRVRDRQFLKRLDQPFFFFFLQMTHLNGQKAHENVPNIFRQQGLQMKATQRSHNTPPRTAIMKRSDDTKRGQEGRATNLPFAAGQSANGTATLGSVW